VTDRRKRRVLDPSKWKPLSQADLKRIYGPHGLSFYSHVRPKPSSTEEREAEEQRSNDEAADEDRRTRRSG
jgi:hypothetical protein